MQNVIFVFLVTLAFTFSYAYGDTDYNCNVRNVDAEIIVYKHKTSQLPNLDVSDMNLWHSLRACLESYGLDPDRIAEISPELKQGLGVADSQNRGQFAIQDWIKDSAERWITDTANVWDFAYAIEFVSKTSAWDDTVPAPTPAGSAPIIPEWYRDVTTWWLDGTISDSEFVDSLQYLTLTKIIRI